MSKKEVGPIYGVPLIGTLKLNGGMMQAMPSRQDLQRVRQISDRAVAGYEVLLTKYHELLAACVAVKKAVGDHCAQTGDVIWIDHGSPRVCESVGDRLFAVIDSCGEVQ